MSLTLYNTLTRKKEKFEPVHPPLVGLYLCGPTVYNDAHLGNARGPIVFDVLTRYLRYLGYQVRYVRNITDVGHLESDADTGEDKMAKAARAKQLEPMQVAQHYTNSYRKAMAALGCLPPDIEPQASGHITEQIALIQEIMGRGLAYEANGSVYFDVPKYNAEGGLYGRLSGRVVEELLAGTRTELAGQDEKRSPADFALWKKASPQHIMRWPSPFGKLPGEEVGQEGFPGWHLECSAMSRKYLGAEFDIHGGGLDLMFPHHECEIAQNEGSNTPGTGARFWLHNNMLTVNGQKMSKSLGNFITLPQMFAGDTSVLSQAYSPMTLRFFFLQAHYRSPVDLSDDALQAARKGYRKLMNGLRLMDKLDSIVETEEKSLVVVDGVEQRRDDESLLTNPLQAAYAALDNDLNTPNAIARLFDALRQFNGFAANPGLYERLDRTAREEATAAYRKIVLDVLGLQEEQRNNSEGLLKLALDFYKIAKANAADARNGGDKVKQDGYYAEIDQIRAALKEQGIVIKDTKTGVEWAYSEE
jgi:cysteinyl-tRNA synthetase